MEYKEKYYSLLNKVKKICDKGGWNIKGMGKGGREKRKEKREITNGEKKISKKHLKKEGVVSSWEECRRILELKNWKKVIIHCRGRKGGVDYEKYYY